MRLLFAAILLMTGAAYAGNSASTYIRQIDAGGNNYDTYVGPNGSGSIINPQAITGGINTFQLWAQRISPSSWQMIGSVSCSPYTPLGVLSAVTQDSWNSLRTRTDKTYTLNINVVMPVGFAGAIAQDLNQYLYWISTPASGPNTNFGPYNYTNGNSYQRTVTPVSTSVQEEWHIDALAVDGVATTQLSAVYVQVCPLPTVGVPQNIPAATVTSELVGLPITTVTVNNLYPANTVLWRLTKPDASTQDFNSQNFNVANPVSATVSLDWSTVTNIKTGAYSFQLLTWTPIAGWEVLLVNGQPTQTFTLTLAVNAKGVHIIKTN